MQVALQGESQTFGAEECLKVPLVDLGSIGGICDLGRILLKIAISGFFAARMFPIVVAR